MDLKLNQSALIFTADESGEVSVDLESPDLDGLAGKICQAIAQKLMSDESFQTELIEMLGDEQDE